MALVEALIAQKLNRWSPEPRPFCRRVQFLSHYEQNEERVCAESDALSVD